jgi:thiamine-monophosphate kinase
MIFSGDSRCPLCLGGESFSSQPASIRVHLRLNFAVSVSLCLDGENPVYLSRLPLPERKLIDRIRAQATARARHLTRGIGDDCAILRPPRGHELLITTDFSLEDVHFRRAWHPPESVGHRCLARGLSDIAAMGGQPLAAFLSLALPADLPQRWVDGFLSGYLKLAEKFDTPLAGGDIAQSPAGALADIMVVGSVPQNRALRRSGARPGDALYVTGALGASAAAVHAMLAGKKLRPPQHPAHFFPEPRLAAGRILRERRLASACIDLSDGLSTDLSHICEESGGGAVVYAESVPVEPGATLDLALHGGEDYELLFTASPRTRIPKVIANISVSRIGEIIRGNRVYLADRHGRRRPLAPRGWEHFRQQT